MGLLGSIPAPENGKSGWPWTEETDTAIYQSLKNLPSISIVTPSYNQGIFLEETIRSIILQNYPKIELIVIDGGSNDNSVKIIKKYEPWIKLWISDKDQGQSDAINKGLEHCTGQLFNWINSDDYLPKNTLFKIAALYSEKPFSLLAGIVEDFDSEGNTIRHKNINLTPENMLLKTKDMHFHQPGVWYRTSLVKNLGKLNIKYHYCFDWHLVIRYLINNPEVIYTDEILARFRLHKKSKTVSVPIRFQEDNIEIANELKENNFFSRLRPELEHYIIMKRWYVNLIKIESSLASKPAKISRIVLSSLKDIKNRWSRYTLGTIKKILLE